MRRGQYSYHNVARLFQQQTHESSYSDYKESLIEYLCFSISDLAFLNVIEAGLNTKLPPLYQMHDRDAVDPSLNLRTCNRLIDFLITEDKEYALDACLSECSNRAIRLNIAVMLLKIVADFSQLSAVFRGRRLANLINYYKQFTEAGVSRHYSAVRNFLV